MLDVKSGVVFSPLAVKDNVVEIDKTDAFDGTPVLDIKPFLPGYDTADDAKVPGWAKSN